MHRLKNEPKKLPESLKSLSECESNQFQWKTFIYPEGLLCRTEEFWVVSTASESKSMLFPPTNN